MARHHAVVNLYSGGGYPKQNAFASLVEGANDQRLWSSVLTVFDAVS